MTEWMSITLLDAIWAVGASVAIFAAVVAIARMNGLRTFSKMSSFDFAVTVAIGSLIASIALGTAPLPLGVIALASIVGAQRLVSTLRRRTRLERLVDNTPLLLVREGVIIEEHMRRGRVTHDDLRAKLREANVTGWAAVSAVVLETTGDISVLHGAPIDESLLEGVIGAESFGPT